MRWLVLLVVFGACASESRPVFAPRSVDTCARTAGPRTPIGFRHGRTRWFAKLGKPRHRADDLVVAADAEMQVITGVIAYTVVDKAAEDEDVEIDACIDARWRRLGMARSDDDGRFSLQLTGRDRLPAGLYPMMLRVPADDTTVSFTAFIARPDTPVVVCDVDGTLTASENAIVGEVVLHRTVDAKSDAARALAELAARGYQVIYLTARPRAYGNLTRDWLADHGFPAGPVVLQPGLTLPGARARAAKSRALDRLHAAGVDIALAIGNRATDVEAYTHAGVPSDAIWIEQSQYAAEIRPLVTQHRAHGFSGYRELRRVLGTIRRP